MAASASAARPNAYSRWPLDEEAAAQGLLAGLNAAIFHFFTAGKRLIEWDSSPVSPPSAKMAGYISLFLWACIVVFGRFIAYNWFDPIVQ